MFIRQCGCLNEKMCFAFVFQGIAASRDDQWCINKSRKDCRKRCLCSYIRDRGRNRERDRQRGRQRQGWTVQYTLDKGQTDVLFMIQAAAVAKAPGPRLK